MQLHYIYIYVCLYIYMYIDAQYIHGNYVHFIARGYCTSILW